MRVTRRTMNPEPSPPPVVTPPPEVRCAIYTRKSVTEGLDQAFNSLDAQRESCEAYVASQRQEGWVVLPDEYDDGGFSGGNMERPALQRLLVDIKEGRVDCVLVYKVDRLSRSLMDFARIMDDFEKYNVSFVSVTQQFNSATSMGRLTLNVLLSFAQFEREMISERTRDKMAAARRKGKWVGGRPMLGYDVTAPGGSLVINEEEAAQVRAIYQLYLDHRGLIPVVQDLNNRGWHNKRWLTKKGREYGGQAWCKNSVFRILTNIIYTGHIKYEDKVIKAEHAGIIDPEVWEHVQELLHTNGRTGGTKVRNKHGALLKSKLYCIPCDKPMMHTYTAKRGRRLYRYYVCMHAMQAGWQACRTKSISAPAIETAIVKHIRRVGLNEEIQTEVWRRLNAQKAERILEIDQECRMLEKELARITDSTHNIISGPASGKVVTDKLAENQAKETIVQRRLNEIRNERMLLEREQVEAMDVSRALKLFEPVWESLPIKAQARVIDLLVEQVGFDGRNNEVRVTFTPLGMRLTNRKNEGMTYEKNDLST